MCGSPSAVKMLWPQAVVAVKTTNVEDDNSVGHVLRLFDLSSGVGIRNLYGHGDRITALAIDTVRIASGDENGNVLIWDNRLSLLTIS